MANCETMPSTSSMNNHMQRNDAEMYLRRRIRDPSPNSDVDSDLDPADLSDGMSEEEDNGAGCPLPSTPEDAELLEAEVNFTISSSIVWIISYALVTS